MSSIDIKRTVYQHISDVVQESTNEPVPLSDEQRLVNDLGLKSLDLARIVSTLEFDLGVMPFTGNVAFTRIRTVGDMCRAYMDPQSFSPEQASAGELATLDLDTEAQLAPEITPHHDYHPAQITSPEAVLLTGGTGFLGGYLLADLLVQTKADIYCLVRAKDKDEGRARIMRNLEEQKLSCAGAGERIRPVVGDISQPKMGIEAKEYETLAEKIDACYHSAVWLNWLFPYETLKPANVIGTEELLKFACAARTKVMHKISTVGVFFGSAYDKKTVTEDDELLHWQNMPLAYTQSKWVGDKMVQHARDRGLPVTIHRPSFILGHSKTGLWKGAGDFYHMMLKGCLEMGLAPNWQQLVEAAPVDYVSSAIVYLSLQPSSLGRSFHMKAKNPVLWTELIGWLNDLGCSIQIVPQSDWIAELSRLMQAGGGGSLVPLWTLLSRGTPNKRTILDELDQEHTPVFVSPGTDKALAGSAVIEPLLDPELFRRYLDTLSTVS